MAGWGDDEEEEEQQRTETAVDPATGLKTVTEYRTNAAGQKFRVTKQIKVTEIQTRQAKAVESRKERLRSKKFGQAKNLVDQSNVTIVVHDVVTIQNPREEDSDDAAQQSTVKASMNEFSKKLMMRKLKQKYGMDDSSGLPPPPEDDEEGDRGKYLSAAGAGGAGVGGAAGGESKSYVPPSMRGTTLGSGAPGSALARMAAYDDRDNATLRVTNISEDTAEADLHLLFAPYGRVARIYLAKDRETMISRGFAFVSYINRVDAQRAMDELQGHGYDHLILKIEWAKPSTKEESPGGLSGGFTSGYGKALAQDTKDKVSYASNLTGNK